MKATYFSLTLNVILLIFIFVHINRTGSKKLAVVQEQTTSKSPTSGLEQRVSPKSSSLIRTITNLLDGDEISYIENETNYHFISSLFANFPEKGTQLFDSLTIYEKEEHVDTIMLAFARKDPVTAYTWLLERKGDFSENVYNEKLMFTLDQVARDDPDYAMQIANKSEGPLHDSFYIRLVEGYASINIDQAFDLIVKYDNDQLGDEVLMNSYQSVISKHAIENPIDAADIVANLDSPLLQTMLVESIVLGLEKEGNRDFTLDWLSSLHGENARKIGTNALIQQMGIDEIEEVYSTLVSSPKLANKSSIKLSFEAIAARKPLEASKLMSKAPSNSNPELSGILAKSWLSTDTDAALNWASSISDQKSYDAAATEIANHFLSTAPETAGSYIAGINNTNTRLNLLKKLVNRTPVDKLDRFINNRHTYGFSDSELSTVMEIHERRIKDNEFGLIVN